MTARGDSRHPGRIAADRLFPHDASVYFFTKTACTARHGCNLASGTGLAV
jgi:hypothetical protein